MKITATAITTDYKLTIKTTIPKERACLGDSSLLKPQAIFDYMRECYGMIGTPDCIHVSTDDRCSHLFFAGKDYNSTIESWDGTLETIKSWLNDCEDSDVVAKVFELVTGVPCRVVPAPKDHEQVHFGWNIP